MPAAINVSDPLAASAGAGLADGLPALKTHAECGPDLAHDPVFHTMQQALAGRAEQQWGDTLVPAVEPDWLRVRSVARELSQRTRDLRVLVSLARAESRHGGVEAVVPVLQETLEALTTHWDHVHPLLDPHAAEDGVDPATARFSALFDIATRSGLAADLRAFHGDEAQASVDADTGPAVCLAARTTADLLGRISTALANRAADAPLLDVQALCSWLGRLSGPLAATSEIASVATGATADDLPVDRNGQDPLGQAKGGSSSGEWVLGAPMNRAGCGRLLDLIVEWLEQNEPAHPAPLLLRRARRLLDANFMQILRDLAPDAAHGVEQLAGGTPGTR